MRGHWLRRGLKVFLVVAIGAIVLSAFVMTLWNWLMPALFGRSTITVWQALGLLVLSKILFGGFRPRFGASSWWWRRRMLERWEQMTPEEREKFREGLNKG